MHQTIEQLLTSEAIAPSVAGLWRQHADWLSAPGSLTRYMRDHTNTVFHLLSAGKQRVSEQQAICLQCDQSAWVWQREVAWLQDSVAIVTAQSVTPLAVAEQLALATMGAQPLGEVIFKQQISSGPFHFNYTRQNQQLTLLRQRVLHTSHGPIWVQECFSDCFLRGLRTC